MRDPRRDPRPACPDRYVARSDRTSGRPSAHPPIWSAVWSLAWASGSRPNG